MSAHYICQICRRTISECIESCPCVRLGVCDMCRYNGHTVTERQREDKCKMHIKNSMIDEEGRWVLSVQITDPAVWNRIKRGQVPALSVGGEGHLVARLPWYARMWKWLVGLWWRAWS